MWSLLQLSAFKSGFIRKWKGTVDRSGRWLRLAFQLQGGISILSNSFKA